MKVHEIVENPHALISDIIAKITSWTEKYKDERGMTNKITDWVIPSHDTHQPGNIYLNPKAHKPLLCPGRLIAKSQRDVEHTFRTSQLLRPMNSKKLSLIKE